MFAVLTSCKILFMNFLCQSRSFLKEIFQFGHQFWGKWLWVVLFKLTYFIPLCTKIRSRVSIHLSIKRLQSISLSKTVDLWYQMITIAFSVVILKCKTCSTRPAFPNPPSPRSTLYLATNIFHQFNSIWSEDKCFGLFHKGWFRSSINARFLYAAWFFIY